MSLENVVSDAFRAVYIPCEYSPEFALVKLAKALDGINIPEVKIARFEAIAQLTDEGFLAVSLAFDRQFELDGSDEYPDEPSDEAFDWAYDHLDEYIHDIAVQAVKDGLTDDEFLNSYCGRNAE